MGEFTLLEFGNIPFDYPPGIITAHPQASESMMTV
jgi:hypothetical protein